MTVIEVARELFEELGNVAERAVSDPSTPLPSRLHEICKGSDLRMMEAYRAEVRNVLESGLRELGVNERPDSWPYAEDLSVWSMPQHMLQFLFWVWLNGSCMSEEELALLIRAVVEGAVGYRLIDIHLDDQKLGAEAIVMGTYLVRGHEHRLALLFGSARALPVLKKHADLYASAEYIEKRNRWQSCPFSWSDPARLAWKAAPLLAVTQLVMDRCVKSQAHIQTALEGLHRVVAFMQMSDDCHDAAHDLANGIETLTMSGFYAWNAGRAVDAARVDEFFDQRRSRLWLTTMLTLIDSAIADFERIDEPIFLLIAAQMKNSLLHRCDVLAPN